MTNCIISAYIECDLLYSEFQFERNNKKQREIFNGAHRHEMWFAIVSNENKKQCDKQKHMYVNDYVVYLSGGFDDITIFLWAQ